MAVTRINNNQITDSSAGNSLVGINAGTKVQDFSITAGKIANNLTYGSDFTITGNLTVNGQTTTIDTVSTVIEDPVIVLAANQTGAPAVDIGFIGERGTANNVAFVWDESVGEFVTAFTTSLITNTTITIASYSNFHTNDANIGGNIVINGTTSLVGNITSALNVTGNVTGGNVLTPGLVSATGNVSGGNLVTAGRVVATGNVVGGNIATTGITSTGSLTASTTVAATGNVSGGNVTTAGQMAATGNVSGGNVTTAGITSTGSLTASTTVAATGNVSGGNVTTAGQVVATGNVSGGNIATAGITATGSLTASTTIVATGNVSGGNVTTAGQVVATGNITGGNLITAGTFSAASISTTGNITGGNLITTGITSTGSLTASTTVAATGNVSGGNITTTGITSTGSLLATGNVTGGNLSAGSGIISTTGNINGANVNASAGITAGTTVAAIGNVSGGNLITGGNINGANVNATSGITAGTTIAATGNVSGGNIVTAGQVTATGNVSGGNLITAGITSTGSLTASTTINATGNITGGNVITTGVTNTGTLNTTGNAIVGGNLIVQGNISYLNIEDLRVEDPIIILGTGPNGAPLTADDGKDRGIFMEYFKTGIGNAFTGFDNSSGNMVIASNVRFTANDVVGVNSYGTLEAGNLYIQSAVSIGNVTGGNLITVGITSTGSLTASTIIAATGNVTGGNLSAGSGIISTTGIINGANINASANIVATGNVSGGNLITTGITSTGSLTASTTINATGNITGGNLTTAGITSTGSLTASTTIAATGNVSGGNLTTAGQVTATGNVSGANVNITGNIVDTGAMSLITGASGNINLAPNGTNTVIATTTGANVTGTLGVTGNITGGNIATAGQITATGNINGTGAVFSGNVTAQNFIGNISGNIDAGGANTNIQFNDADILAGSAAFTFNKISNAVVVSGNVSAGNLSAGSGIVSTTGNINGANVNATAGITAGSTITATGNVSGGNVTTAGQVTATGNVSGGNVVAVALITGANVSATSNITGANVVGTTSTRGGNITISASNIDSSAARITINGADADVDFAVDGDTVANVFYVDAGTGTASFGTSTQTTNALVAFNATTSVLMPVGNTAQRPATGVTGMIRFNSTTNSLEIFDNSQYTAVGVPVFTVIDDQQFNGNGVAVAFTINSNQTTNSCIVSINGVVQIPTIAYSVAGTTLTFTEAPQSGDIIDVRQLTTTTTVTSISNSSGNAIVQVSDTTNDVSVTGDLVVSGSVSASSFIGLDASKISNGTSEMAVVASGGNIRANIGGTTVQTISAGLVAITGDLSVTGNATLSGNILGDRVQNGTTSFDIQTPSGNANISVGGTSNVAVFSTAGLSLGTGSLTVGGIVNSNANGVGNIGSATTFFNTVFAKATSAQYADLAEKYTADAEYAPGTVVVFGGDKEVTVSSVDADRAVAGVVSTNPSYIMNAGLEAEHVATVALTGRVPCRVVGTVAKGDLMVSAGNGRARADQDPRVGTVIGKALENHQGTEGVIEVVVGRF